MPSGLNKALYGDKQGFLLYSPVYVYEGLSFKVDFAQGGAARL